MNDMQLIFNLNELHIKTRYQNSLYFYDELKIVLMFSFHFFFFSFVFLTVKSILAKSTEKRGLKWVKSAVKTRTK